jgi:hypothetical protein
MNESMLQPILQPISNALGISPLIFGVLVSFCLLVVLAISTYLWTGNIALSSLAQFIGSIVTSALGFTPAWVVPIFVFIALLSFWKYSYVGETKIRYPDSYRERLIGAYKAKFGYLDPGFLVEVDIHIRAVETLRRGYTRSVHKTKLKKLEKFVELK